MSIYKIILCLSCAIGSSCGQILMKASSIAWKKHEWFYNTSVLLMTGCSFFVCCASSLGWVYILKELPLSTAYPFLAISFILVPIAGHFFYNELINWKDGIAALLIISGICIVSFTRNPT